MRTISEKPKTTKERGFEEKIQELREHCNKRYKKFDALAVKRINDGMHFYLEKGENAQKMLSVYSQFTFTGVMDTHLYVSVPKHHDIDKLYMWADSTIHRALSKAAKVWFKTLDIDCIVHLHETKFRHLTL